MEPLTIRIASDTKESIESEAADRDMSTAEYTRELIAKGLRYDERVAELESQVVEDGDVSELRDRIATLEDERDELRDDRREKEAEIGELQGRLQEIRNNLDEKDERLADKDDRIESLESELQVKNGRLNELEDMTKAANKKATDIQPARSGLLGGLRRRLFGSNNGDE